MRLVLRSLGVLLIVLVAAAGGLYLYLRTSLPVEDGTVTVPGLSTPVQIVRDRNGIPHIYAQSAADAYFGLGYVHAQDRLWQMEMNRRIGAGRLSEIAGAATFDLDAMMRTLGLRRLAQAQAAALTGDAKTINEAYAAGVNAFLATRRGALPPEFLLAKLSGAGAFAPWQPADSLTFHKLMALDLSGNWSSELSRLRLAKTLDQRQIEELSPPYPGDAPVTVADLGDLYRQVADSLDLTALAAAIPRGPTEGVGSNNWVVGNRRSASGKPLLANDPHLGLTAPSIWYLAHLSAPGLEVMGATFPGTPGVVLGRNRTIAWGMTNTGPDTQDVYIEKIDPADPARYVTPGGSAAFTTREEIVRLRGGEERRITVRGTRHGPVISDLRRSAGLADPGHALALRWTALDPDDRTAEAIQGLSTARNWEDFVASLRLYGAPMQNIVFADVNGNTGFIAPGKIPIRKAENDLKGTAPAPGWDARYDWTGYVPFDELPRLYNPASGAIATANHKIISDSYKHFLTNEWNEPYRILRIEQLLSARTAHSPESFKAMQGDAKSLMASDLLPRMLALLPASLPSGPARIRDTLARWDGNADPVRPEALMFAAWYRELTRLIAQDELGDLFAEQWRLRPLFIGNVLSNVGGQARWCDDTRTPATESCAQMSVKALEQADAYLRATYGGDPSRWQWGEAHVAVSSHRPFGAVPVLRDLFDIRVASAGDAFTVNVGRHNIASETQPFANVHAAGLRAIYDLADPDRAWFMISTGQSGNPFSDLYRGFVRPWAAVDYALTSMRRVEVDAGARGTLTLEPPR